MYDAAAVLPCTAAFRKFFTMAKVIDRLRAELNNTVGVIDNWFLVDDVLMNYTPVNKGWSIRQNLEHITLTNHYLLILIKKGTDKAIEKATRINYTEAWSVYDLDWDRLEAIGAHASFSWIRPMHMEPEGLLSLTEIKEKLSLQVREVADCLQKLANGEGVLYKTMMSVNGLGKIDVYHYIYFLVQHMKRHIGQMEKIRLGFDQL